MEYFHKNKKRLFNKNVVRESLFPLLFFGLAGVSFLSSNIEEKRNGLTYVVSSESDFLQEGDGQESVLNEDTLASFNSHDAFYTPVQFFNSNAALSTNFSVRTNDGNALLYAQCLEDVRSHLAVDFFGFKIPNFDSRVDVSIHVEDSIGAGGESSFIFDNKKVFGWEMNLKGRKRNVISDVIPHEMSHILLAYYFKRPVPRWADEGFAASLEQRSSLEIHDALLTNYLYTKRGIAFSEMITMKEYPSDVLPFYAQSHSVVQYLISKGGGNTEGRRKFIDFLGIGFEDENWPRALHEIYGFNGLIDFQNEWLVDFKVNKKSRGY